MIFIFYWKRKTCCPGSPIPDNVYGEDVFKQGQYVTWFVKFWSGDFSVKDAPHLGSLIKVDDDQLKNALVESNYHLVAGEIYMNITIAKSNVENHLKHLGQRFPNYGSRPRLGSPVNYPWVA